MKNYWLNKKEKEEAEKKRITEAAREIWNEVFLKKQRKAIITRYGKKKV